MERWEWSRDGKADRSYLERTSRIIDWLKRKGSFQVQVLDKVVSLWEIREEKECNFFFFFFRTVRTHLFRGMWSQICLWWVNTAHRLQVQWAKGWEATVI